MAAATGSSLSLTSASLSLNRKQVGSKISNVNSVSLSVNVKSFRSSRLRSASQRFHVSCAAKPDTVDKVCKIVRKQLALSDDTKVTGESKFAALGADSLDTVEVVMGIEEEFGISVEEESAQSIVSIQDAADLVEKIISNDSSQPKV